METTQQTLTLVPLSEKELETASLFARNHFENSLAIFYNDEGVEQFHDSVSDFRISERMQQVSRFYLAKYEGKIVGFFELYRRRHLTLLLLEKQWTHKEGLRQVISFLQQELSARERDLYLMIHAAPTGYTLFLQNGFQATGEEQVYAGGISSLMTLRW